MNQEETPTGKHPLVVLDLDGTVCENGHRIDWGRPESVARLCRPYREAKDRVARMNRDGWMPVFLSSRYEWTMMDVTMRQIAAWFGEDVAARADVDLCMVSMEGEHIKLRRALYLQHKVAALRFYAEGRDLVYVGDLVWDAEAAEMAGVRFMWAHDWRAGVPFDRAVVPSRRPVSPPVVIETAEVSA